MLKPQIKVSMGLWSFLNINLQIFLFEISDEGRYRKYRYIKYSSPALEQYCSLVEWFHLIVSPQAGECERCLEVRF